VSALRASETPGPGEGSFRVSRRPLLLDLGLHELSQQRQGLLPAEVASLDGDCAGYALLHDGQLRADRHLFQRDRGLHLSGQVRVVELVRVANAFVGHELQELATERMAMPCGEVREGHLVRTADLGLDVLDLACEAVRRQPLCHGIGIEERSIDPLRWCTKYPVKLDGVLGHCLFSLLCDGRWAVIGSPPSFPTMSTNVRRADRHAPFHFLKQARACEACAAFCSAKKGFASAARPRPGSLVGRPYVSMSRKMWGEPVGLNRGARPPRADRARNGWGHPHEL